MIGHADRSPSPRTPACSRAAAALLLALLALPGAPAARADGCFVWRNQRVDIREPEQKALIVFDRGIEDLVLEVRYEGAAGDFGWIVPLPSRPDIAPEKARLFEELSRLTQRPPYVRGELHRRGTMTLGATSEVRVLERRRVGVYDTAILSGGGDALAGWLRRNGFPLPAGSRRVLDDYARRGWLFAALRIHPAVRDSGLEKPLLEGTIQPLRFRFATPRPVYPLSISALNRGNTVVLLYVLARAPLVHRTCDGATWDEHLFGPFGAWGAGDREQPRYRGLDLRRGHLTKLRALVAPQHMEDVYFRPYDPAPALRSPWLATRAEAASDLGWRKPAGAESLLVRFLEGAQGSGPDVTSALAALGQVGGPAAVPVLERWFARSDSLVHVEALEALTRVRGGPPPAFFARALGEARGPYTDLERRACLDVLLRRGDSTCVPVLRAMAASPVAAVRPMAWEPTLADYLRAALVACGDGGERAAMRDELAREACRLDSSWLAEFAQRRGSSNDLPMGFWTARSILQPYEVFDWPSFQRAGTLFRQAPVQGDLFRELLRDGRLPDAPRLVLAGRLDSLLPADRDTVFAIWRRSLGPAGPRARIAVQGTHPRWGPWEGVVYNLNACGAAYVFAGHHDADALLRLAAEVPARDTVLRAEIVFTLAAAGSPRGNGAILDYVRTEWGRVAAEPRFEREVLASRTPNGRLTTHWRPDLLDLAYRSRAIEGHVCHAGRDTATLRRLLADGSLHPFVRIYLIERIPFFEADCVPLFPLALETLDAIAAEPGASAFQSDLARDTRTSMVAVHDAMARRERDD